MTHYVLKRLLGLLPTLLIVAVLVFLFVHLLPGDPARLAAGVDAGPETVALVRQELGLDKPLPQQFFHFIGNLFQGDFGTSLRSSARCRPRSPSASCRRFCSPSPAWSGRPSSAWSSA